MLDAFSLDQLRTFIAAVDEGSFSAASRKLLRAQSVVSETISKLEEQIGVIGSLPVIPDTLTYERLPGIAFLMVAARDHALTSYRGKIPREVLAKHTQIVLTDRSELSSGREFGVMSPATWRLADLFAKHHFLLNGLGWGGMPLHAVRKDLEEGRLSVLPGRWFVDRLKQMPVDTGKVPKPPVTRKRARPSAKT